MHYNNTNSHLNTKETEKLNKYKDLETEIGRMWNVRTKVVPVIIVTLGTVEKGLDLKLQLLPGHSSVTDVQKITSMSTAHIILKVPG